MRQGQPNCAQLQQAGSLGIDDAARNINMGDGVSIEKKVAVLKVVEKRKQRYKRSYTGHARDGKVGNVGVL
jgi:hypothetical protein